MGVSVRQNVEVQTKSVHDLVERTAAKLGCGNISVDKVIVDDNYVGQGYGVPAESTLEAIMLAARMEGILLDPVYSGKGFAGMVGLIREKFFKEGDNVVFLHTGGSAALFAYQNLLSRHIGNE